MKALSLLVRKLWPRLKFLTVVKGLVTRNTHVQYASPITSGLKVLSKVKVFFKSRSNFKVKFTRSKIMVRCERSCHKEYTSEIWKLFIFNGLKVMAKVNVFCPCSQRRRRRQWKGYDISSPDIPPGLLKITGLKFKVGQSAKWKQYNCKSNLTSIHVIYIIKKIILFFKDYHHVWIKDFLSREILTSHETCKKEEVKGRF